MCTELFYAIIPTLFLCFFLICYLYILLHLQFFGSRHRIDLQCTGYSSENIYSARTALRNDYGFSWIYL